MIPLHLSAFLTIPVGFWFEKFFHPFDNLHAGAEIGPKDSISDDNRITRNADGNDAFAIGEHEHVGCGAEAILSGKHDGACHDQPAAGGGIDVSRGTGEGDQG